MSVSIPSGCRGKPDSSEAIARMTVASRSLRNKKRVCGSIDYFSSNVTEEQKWVLILKYSATPLIQSPTGHEYLAALPLIRPNTHGRINRVGSTFVTGLFSVTS